MKVLLTGALGNVGEFTAGALLQEGHEVVAFDVDSAKARKVAAALDPRVRIVWGDVTDPSSLEAALDGAHAVVHLAALLVTEGARALAKRVNVDATLGLIERMEASPSAKRLVFASSHGIFGEVQDREPPLRTDTPPTPDSDYGRHKLACERAIRSSKLRWSILRLAVAPPVRLIGYSHDPSKAFEFSPDGRIEFVHPADAGTAFARAVACEASVGRILYIGGGARCQMRNLEFTNELMGAIGIGPLPAEAFVRTDVPRFSGDWVDSGESQRLLGYQTRGIRELGTDMRRSLGLAAPLIRLFRPIATWGLLRRSPYLKGNRRAARSKANR